MPEILNNLIEFPIKIDIKNIKNYLIERIYTSKNDMSYKQIELFLNHYKLNNEDSMRMSLFNAKLLPKFQDFNDSLKAVKINVPILYAKKKNI